MTTEVARPMLTLRNYQKEGVIYLRNKKRAMLYDKPGLGKSIQASEAAEGRTLVLTRAHWVSGWADFLHDQYPDQKVNQANGTYLSRMDAMLSPSEWVVANIEMLRSYPFHLLKWGTVIFDESHHLRGRYSKQSLAAHRLAKVVDRVYLLTATPVYTEPDDLFAQFRLIDDKTFKSYHSFIDQYCYTAYTPWGAKVQGPRSRKVLRKLIGDYGLGRTYEEVELELPNKIEQTIKVSMSKETMERYHEVQDYLRLDDSPLRNSSEALHRLRDVITSGAKMEATEELAGELDSYVIFTWYVQSAQRLASRLGARCITGETPAHKRLEIAKSTSKVVANIACMSEGIDLTHLKNVIFFEEPYQYGQVDQAMSRVQRWSASGNLGTVLVYYVLAKDTVDEVIHATVRRRSNIDQILREALA